MTNDGQSIENFGCERCWPPNADAAWEARGTLSGVGELIDESHYHVMILGCPRCDQRFLSVFTETIDWENGDDSQYWTLLPLTQAETVDLLQPGALSESEIESLGPKRRCLRRDHPTDVPANISWGTGIIIGLHD